MKRHVKKARSAHAVKRRSESVGIMSVEIGMSLLNALAETGRPSQLAVLAAATGMPRSKVHKYLASFVRSGFVVQGADDGRYDLGPASLELGLAAMRRLALVELAQDALNEIRNRLDTTASLAVWANRGPVILRWAETPDIVSPTVRLGSVFPVLASTVGQIFAAYLDRRFTNQLIREELAQPKGLAERVGLRTIEDVEHMLGAVRRNGIASGRSIVVPGIASVAAPIFGLGNNIIATIAAVGTAGRFDMSRNGLITKIVVEVTNALSHRMGARDRGGRAQKIET